MKLLSRIFRRQPAPVSIEMAAAGVRSATDAERRRSRIRALTETMEDQSREKVAELTEFLDQWIVFRANKGWTAAPGWDDEPYDGRSTYSTYADACTAVAAVGGVLRPGRRPSY